MPIAEALPRHPVLRRRLARRGTPTSPRGGRVGLEAPQLPAVLPEVEVACGKKHSFDMGSVGSDDNGRPIGKATRGAFMGVHFG